MMILAVASLVGLTLYVNHQRGYCRASGDLSYSDNMTVASDFRGLNEGDIINKFGIKQHICIVPTTTVDWIPGVYIKKAFYEYRNSCMDFSVQDAWFETD